MVLLTFTLLRDVDNSWKAGKIPGCQCDFPGWKTTYNLCKVTVLTQNTRLLNLHFRLWQILATSLLPMPYFLHISSLVEAWKIILSAPILWINCHNAGHTWSKDHVFCYPYIKDNLQCNVHVYVYQFLRFIWCLAKHCITRVYLAVP